jgi:hypothetical protein
MTITNHYGKFVDSEVPVYGIFNLNKFPQFISDGDMDGIDLAYEEWQLDHDCPYNHKFKCYWPDARWNKSDESDNNDGFLWGIEYEDEEWNYKDVEWFETEAERDAKFDEPTDCDCECPDEMERAMLIGDWKKDENGKYIPDPDGEYAIDATGEIYGAVMFSKYTKRVALCSPCFPSCGDLDSEGKFLAYDLPPDAYED